ncbi:MAG: RluA family pseudouridine synthase [Bacteroidota bacterium]|nr:RluA family pseudouridine synthase [Bacteroidota bacterium]
MEKQDWKEAQLDENEYDIQFMKVDPGQSSIRIDQFISERIPKVSRNKIQLSIHAGLIVVNEKNIKPNYKIRPNDLIQLVFPKYHTSDDVLPENIPLDIRYEDDQVMIVNKPPGMTVHPAGDKGTGTLVNALAYYFSNKNIGEGLPTGSSNRYGLVHRIDKDTSGLLIIAKTDYAHTHLSKQFFDHSIQREYIALVWGEPNPGSGRIEGNIGRDPKNRLRMFVHSDGLEGKHAVTHYELLESFYFTSLLRCKLETGRTHQIRVHMKYIGNPLFNDERYSGSQIHKGTVFTKYKQFVQNCFKTMPRFALHAKSLGFIHPETGKEMYFELEIPEDFKQLIERWRHYTAHRKDLMEEMDKDQPIERDIENLNSLK